MKGVQSFHMMAVLFVLFIMVSSSCLTGICLFFLISLRLVPNSLMASLWMPVISLIVSIILGTSISTVASAKFFKPMDDLIDAMRTVAKGDFTVRVDDTQNDGEIGELLESFNTMTEELGSIEMFRSDFINTFSHEFKTPIVSIRGFAKQLKNENITDEQRREYTDIIIAESEKLTNMATNVLLLTKYENQQIITEKNEYSLDEQLRSCILLLEKQWTRKNIQWDIELDQIDFYGNEEIMSHAWVNLLGNAIKFTGENGEIGVRVKETDNEILVRIKDNGVGMSEETLQHIFDKFYQSESSHAMEGNGLGLPLVKRIVELCNGKIVVESEEGKGTTFSVYLPKH